jgi:hypothetical protein
VVLLIIAFAGCAKRPPATSASAPKPAATPAAKEAAMGWSLRSRAFAENAAIPAKHTCDGADLSPELTWTAPPKGTVEMALICTDPDAPGGHFVHWVIYQIPPDRVSLPEGVPTSDALPNLGGAKQGRNGFGRTGYGGPCPPRGRDHHYHFTLYALDAATKLRAGATEAQVMSAMEGHILSRAELLGTYSR